ncbi:MAG: acetyltransferase [Lachnospiraceae bacterium]|nr:acetyltransferase [Lachnospiraceae bacterium]
MSKNVVLWGCGQMAEVAYFYLTNDSEYDVVAFCMDKKYIACETFHEKPVIAFEDIDKIFPPEDVDLCFLISYSKMNDLRTEKYLEAKKKGYKFISYVSSKASYYNTQIGENTFIMENNVIQPYTQIGNNVIMWSGNHLGHHSIIEDNCFVASQVVISGSTIIGQNSFLGVNSTVRDNVRIGKYNLIGAGTVILKDTEDYDVYTTRETIKIEKKSTDVRHI